MSNPTGKEGTLNEEATETTIDPQNYFAVRGWLWNPEEEDYTTVIKHHSALKVFREFQDAENDYEALDYSRFPEAGGKEVRVELTHFRFGTPHHVHSKVLFP